MREFQIMVDPLGAVTVSGSSRLLGYGGEHNVARLNINFNDFEQSVFKDAGYYRLALGDYYSDALYLENGKLSYLVPFDAVTPPMIYCQIIGYTDKEGEPVKIAKSSVFTMEVKFSKVPRAVISNSTDVFERTLAKCEVALKSSLEASNEARLYAESAALSMERSEESSVIAVQSANSARVAAEEAKEALGTLENFATLHNNVANAIKRTVKSNAVAVYDVSPIEHEVDVKVRSKNLIPYTYKGLNRTYQGVTFVDNGDGTITANGTNTSDSETAYVKVDVNLKLPKGTYVLKNIGVPSTQCTLRYRFDTTPTLLDVTSADIIFEATNEITLTHFNVVVAKGVTVDNFIFKPQLELGSVATEYTPYVDVSTVCLGAGGINLYDDTTKEVGKCFGLSNFPEITERTGVNLSDYIRVIPNNTLTLNYGLMWAFYDKDRNYVNQNSSGAKSATIKRIITVPENACYVRFAYHTNNAESNTNYSDGSNVMAVLGVDLPTQYQPFTKPLESYAVNADGTIDVENIVTYTESDGNNFVTYTKVEDADPDYGYLTFDTSLMGNAKALRLTARLETATPTFVYDFSFTRGVTADSYGTATDSTDYTYPITADHVVISVENGMPEKLYTTGGETLIEYTAELIFEGDTTIKSIYPSMSLLTDTDGVLIDVKYNRDINKAFAELQEAIINLGGILNV